MALLRLCVAWSFLVVLSQGQNTTRDATLLYRTLDALTKALHFMDKAVEEINFDAVFCLRRVEEQLQAFLQFQPDVSKNIHNWVDGLRRRAGRIANKGKILIYQKQPEYAYHIGFLLSPSKRLIWYPSTFTSPEAIVIPVQCKDSIFNGTFIDSCFAQTYSDNETTVCKVSPSCMQYNLITDLRDYVLTHQVLFWELMEANNCINKVSLQLRSDFCSNVLRDARQAEQMDFPMAYRDLFLEQIGLCGIWGFKDFHKKEWLEKILQWQRHSGCYDGPIPDWPCTDYVTPANHPRVKRTETIISDGCLSHKTAVALLALAASVRFEAEEIFALQAGPRSVSNVL